MVLEAFCQRGTGQPVDLKQGVSQWTQGWLKPGDFVVQKAENVASQQVVCRHVLLRLNLNASCLWLFDEAALGMDLDHIKGVVVKGVDKLGHKGTNVDSVDGKTANDEEALGILKLNTAFVFFDDVHHKMSGSAR